MKYQVMILFLMFMQIAKSQNHDISGYVEDLKTGERIIGAYVIDSISKNGTSTNNFGFYSLKNVNRKVTLMVTYLGNHSKSQTLVLKRDTILNFSINPVSEIQEVVIESSQYNRDENTPLGLTLIPIKLLTSLPALGEADLLKSIQSQPGIKGGLEGSAGIFVRGGGAGENLFLLDDVPIYNVSHLYGFFSAFNVNAVKDLELFKGDFPARYGGRSSSIIDVRSQDGNNKSIKGVVSLGLISSSLTLEGPLGSDKTTFMISGRRSYLNLITQPLKKTGQVDSSFPDYYFYDLNGRITHTFSQKDRIYLSFYTGKDHILSNVVNNTSTGTYETFTENSQTVSGWNNLITCLRWNHIFGKSLFVNTTIAYSGYNYFIQQQYNSLDNTIDPNSSVSRNYFDNYSSGINDLIAKTDFDYSLSQIHRLRFGVGLSFHTFNPGLDVYNVNDQSLGVRFDTTYANSPIHAIEPALYLEDEIHMGPQIILNAGIRISSFNSQTSHVVHPEPRISANYKLLPGLVMKVGYSRMVQYMHLLSSYNVSWPSDLWIPATNGIQALKSDQVNIGFAYNLNKKILFSLEAYNKWLLNPADYQNGASMGTEFVPWYEKVTQGKGLAKGLEISIAKQQGCLTGSMNYTLASSTRTYANLNGGQTFPFNYDRRNDFNISINYKLSEKWNVSAFWVYGTGYPATVPTVKYLPNVGIYNGTSKFGGEVDYYPSLNNNRLPAYHRLDLGFHRTTKCRLGEQIWSFDIFNVYNRKNPDYMYYDRSRHSYFLTYGSLLPIIPSVTYTLKFK